MVTRENCTENINIWTEYYCKSSNVSNTVSFQVNVNLWIVFPYKVIGLINFGSSFDQKSHDADMTTKNSPNKCILSLENNNNKVRRTYVVVCYIES